MSENKNKTLRMNFLEQFNSTLQCEIIEFGKRISACNSDVYIFMARKSICFYECLRFLKLASVDGVVTTDRVLDMNSAWLKGKTVSIIDDAVISGTTLHDINKELQNIGAIVKKNCAFCVSTTWWNKDTFEPDEPFLRLSHQHTTGFCSDLVRAISLLPQPYAVDYPLYRNIRISDHNNIGLYNQQLWKIRNISTPIQNSVGAISLVATPSQSYISRISRMINIDIPSISSIMKLRLYGRRIDKHKATWFTVMPIIVFNPLLSVEVDELFNRLTTNLPQTIKHEIVANANSLSSKLRILQYTISSIIGRIILEDISISTASNFKIQLDMSAAGYIFNPFTCNAIKELCKLVRFDSSSVYHHSYQCTSSTTINGIFSMPAESPWEMQAKLLQPFLDLHAEKEIPARNLALKHGSKAFEQQEYKTVLNRLRVGYSTSELRSLASGSPHLGTPAEILSEFLDYAVDRGFIVPITVPEDTIVYRAYRHGEDILDSEQFRCLVVNCMIAFTKASKTQSIPKIWLEKIIVILLQTAVERNIIPPADVMLENYDKIGVRYDLHGAVVKEYTSKVYSHYDGTYYTEILRRLGYIELSSNNEFAPVNCIHDTPYKATSLELAKNLGLVIGTLYNNDFPVSLSIKKLTLLATCMSPRGVSCAVAAELEILYKEWKYFLSIVERDSGNTGNAHIKLARRHPVFIAINSAKFKLTSYLCDKVKAIITSIHGQCSEVDDLSAEFMSNTWAGLWDERLTIQNSSDSDPCHEHVSKITKTIFEFNLYIRMLLLSTAHDINTQMDILNDIRSIYYDYCIMLSSPLIAKHNIKCTRSIPETIDKVREFLQNVVTDQHKDRMNVLKSWSKDRIDRMLGYIPATIDIIDAIASKHGKPNNFDRFEHALYVDLLPNAVAASTLYEFDKLYQSASVTARKAAKTYFSITDYNGDQSKRVVLCRGDYSIRELLSFCRQIKQASTFATANLVLFIGLPSMEQPIQLATSSNIRMKALSQRILTVIRNQSVFSNKHKEFVVVTTSDAYDNQIYQLAANLSMQYRGDGSITFPFEHPSFTNNILTSCVLSQKRKQFSTRENVMNDITPADIGIICVTPSELSATLETMKSLEDFHEDVRFTFYSAYAQGDNCRLRIAMCRSLSTGNVSIPNAYHAITKSYKPKLVVLLGMSGGIHKDVRLCDVVIGDRYFYYEPKKSRPTGTTTRGDGLKLHPTLRKLVAAFEASFHNGKPMLPAEKSSENGTFSVHVGPIGTGEEVVGYKESETRKWLNTVNDQVLVVETEAWGVNTSYYESAAWPTGTQDKAPSVLVVRGVSDHADHEKNDEYQHVATKHAFLTLLEFLKMLQPSDLVC